MSSILNVLLLTIMSTFTIRSIARITMVTFTGVDTMVMNDAGGIGMTVIAARIQTMIV